MILSVLVISTIILLLIGVPIAASLGIATMVSVFMGGTQSLSYVCQQMGSATNSFPLLAVPLFIFAGELMGAGGISNRLLKLADVFLGRKHGGLAMVTIVVCMFFAAVSGSGPATVAAVGGITIPTMLKQGYDKPYSTGISAIAGSIGVIIPPSIPMVIYCTTVGASVSDMFLGGFIPGLLVGFALLLYSHFYCSKRNYVSDDSEPFSWKRAGQAAWEAKWAVLMPVIILGGIYAGIFTPTEAASVACVYGLIVGCFIHHDIDIKLLKKCMINTMATSGTVMFVVTTATAFSRVLSLEKAPAAVAAFITSIISSRVAFLLAVNILLLIVGCFCDVCASIMILAPVLLPVAQSFGIDIIHFGIIMVVNLAFGMITPPVGANLYVACRIGDCSVEETSRGVIGPLLTALIALLIITFIPQTATFLPNLVNG